MSTHPLVGRATELARLEEAVADAVAGTGGLVLVTGEAGIGKTSLIDSALRSATSRAVVVWGTCREGPEVPGFWPWIEVIRNCGTLGLLPGNIGDQGSVLALAADPGQTSGAADDRTAGQQRFGMFDAVGRLLRAIADRQPLVIVLDDLQWADAGTLRLLQFLVADLPRSPVLVIGAYRDEEVDHRLGSVGDLLDSLAARTWTLPLRRLVKDEVAELMSQLLSAPQEPGAVADMHRRTGGNPFYIQQVSRLGPTSSDLPGGARDAVRRRLALLPAGCVDLLEVAAVNGRDLDVRLVARAADRSPADVVEGLEAATRSRFLERTGPERYRFAHDLFREVVYAGLDPVTQARLHNRVADALEALPAEGVAGLPADLARHRVRGVVVTSPGEAVPYIRRAADDATARLAYEEAAAHLREGVRLAALAGDEATWLNMLVDLGDAHRRAGELQTAQRHYHDAAAAARRMGDANALARAALGHHNLGVATWSMHSEAIRILEEALEARRDVEDGVTASLSAALSRELAHGPGDRVRAVRLSERAVAIARAHGDPEVLALCLFASHDARWAPGSARERLIVLEEMAAAAAAAGDGVLAWEAMFGQFVALVELADPAAYTVFLQVVDGAEQLGQPHYRWVVRSRRAVLAMLRGRFEEAEALIGQVAIAAERLGEPDGRNVVADLTSTLVMMYGELDRLRDQAPKHEELLPPSMRAAMEAFGLIEHGDVETAVTRLRPWIDPVLDGARGWQLLGAMAMIAYVVARAEDRELSSMMYGRLLPHAEEMVVTGGAVNVAGPVALYLGLCAAALGRTDDALAHLTRSLEIAERMDARPWAARAQYEIARMLLRRGAHVDREQARQRLAQAVRTSTALGMTRDVDRAQALLTTLTSDNVFQRDDNGWILAFAGEVVRIPDAKGLGDIARLLACPGVEIAAPDLIGEQASAEAGTGSDPVLDDTAREAYRRRIQELVDEIEQADRQRDIERASRARGEHDALVEALSAAYGLGQRARRLGSSAERARKTVSARIRDSLNRIERRHPLLGKHLRESIVTGSRCSYRPADEVRWRL